MSELWVIRDGEVCKALPIGPKRVQIMARYFQPKVSRGAYRIYSTESEARQEKLNRLMEEQANLSEQITRAEDALAAAKAREGAP